MIIVCYGRHVDKHAEESHKKKFFRPIFQVFTQNKISPPNTQEYNSGTSINCLVCLVSLNTYMQI